MPNDVVQWSSGADGCNGLYVDTRTSRASLLLSDFSFQYGTDIVFSWYDESALKVKNFERGH